MKTINLIILMLVMWGCGENQPLGPQEWSTYYSALETRENRVKFIQQCIKDANPMSDEELSK